MAEERIVYNSGVLKIEGLLNKLPGDKGAIVTHPHPLYGGDMYNNVVGAVCRAYWERGYSSLRFNFRGVGASEGQFDNGKGEREDLKAAIDYFYTQDKKEIDLIGYSFGSWVNALGLDRLNKVKEIIMISPPVEMIDFSFLKYDPRIKLVITGEGDDIGKPDAIKKLMPIWNPEAELKIIKGADHFYLGKTDEIRKLLDEFLKS